MPHYKAPDNSLHCIDAQFIDMLPSGSVKISDEYAESLRQEPKNTDTKLYIRSQIKTLEYEQLMPRATREFMLIYMEANATPEVLAVNPGYQAVKAFDEQIKALRVQL